MRSPSPPSEATALSTPAVHVSVVVPTAGRPDGLARLLDALAAQPDPHVGWEVVVVDNHPDPVVAPWARSRPDDLPLRVVHEPTPGASAARNRGVDEARGAWTALLDDDVVPAADWLAEVVAASQSDHDGAGGRVLLDPEVVLPAWMDTSLAGLVTHLDLGPTARPLEPTEYVLTANAVMRTSLLRRVRFDLSLGPRPGAHLTNDDLDVVRRSLQAGARLWWRPTLVVVHDAPRDRLTVRWLASRAYQQGRSDRRLDADQAASARWGGLRAGGWYLRDRTAHWWAVSERRSTFLAHLLAETARTLGWWRECVAAVRRRG